jgi:hypothetical protein
MKTSSQQWDERVLESYREQLAQSILEHEVDEEYILELVDSEYLSAWQDGERVYEEQTTDDQTERGWEEWQDAKKKKKKKKKNEREMME